MKAHAVSGFAANFKLPFPTRAGFVAVSVVVNESSNSFHSPARAR
jgi:hypothetical protein